MHFTRHLRYGNVMSTLALVLALGGTSYAAVSLPANSVGARQLKPDAVTTAKVRNGSLLAADVAAGQLPAGPKGDKGDPGAAGAQGVAGPQGPAGPIAMLARINAIPSTFDQATTYGSPSGNSTANANEAGVSMLSPNVALKASSLAVSLTNPVNNNSARRFTLRVAGQDTALTCTMGSFGSTCSSNASVTVPPNSLLSIKSDRPADFNADGTDARIAFQLTQ